MGRDRWMSVLYHTHLGGWVLNVHKAMAIAGEEAVSWLIRNGHEIPPDAEDTAFELEY